MGLCIGLTGGIGCGKSTVSKLFESHGITIIDTDTIAHQITQCHGIAIPALQSTFGSSYLTPDGALNRDRMRSLIFTDSDAKHRLENILHPMILDLSRQQLTQSSTQPYVIMVVPLLLTSEAFQQMIHRTLVVDCSEEQQVARVLSRSRMGELEIRNIIHQQPSRLMRLNYADDIIKNETSPNELISQVDFLHHFYSTLQNTN
jgi:dephospho-CoA kinase